MAGNNGHGKASGKTPPAELRTNSQQTGPQISSAAGSYRRFIVPTLPGAPVAGDVETNKQIWESLWDVENSQGPRHTRTVAQVGPNPSYVWANRPTLTGRSLAPGGQHSRRTENVSTTRFVPNLSVNDAIRMGASGAAAMNANSHKSRVPTKGDMPSPSPPVASPPVASTNHGHIQKQQTSSYSQDVKQKSAVSSNNPVRAGVSKNTSLELLEIANTPGSGFDGRGPATKKLPRKSDFDPNWAPPAPEPAGSSRRPHNVLDAKAPVKKNPFLSAAPPTINAASTRSSLAQKPKVEASILSCRSVCLSHVTIIERYFVVPDDDHGETRLELKHGEIRLFFHTGSEKARLRVRAQECRIIRDNDDLILTTHLPEITLQSANGAAGDAYTTDHRLMRWLRTTFEAAGQSLIVISVKIKTTAGGPSGAELAGGFAEAALRAGIKDL